MNLAWYTPFSENSAIGRFSHLVIQALRELDVTVQVIRSEARTPTIRAAAPTCRSEKVIWAADLDRSLETALAEFDLVVYNLGDHYDYHCFCYQHQTRRPGLSIVHDYSLHHALHHYCLAAAGENGTYADHLLGECGAAATRQWELTLKEVGEQSWWQQEIVRFPVYRWALRNTLGAITHAEFYRDVLAQRVGCPVTTIPLAYDAAWEPNATEGVAVPTTAPPPSPSGKMTILTVGAVNANKRHQIVIHALAQSRFLRERCQYRIVGPIHASQRQMLEHYIHSLPHRADVVILGQVDRTTLSHELAQADIISCLRSPALEGASASVIEALLTAKPVIVCDTGCYQEIPDELVYKINPQRERSELIRTLEQLVRHYDDARQSAAAGRTWAATRHAPTTYARQFLKFAQRVLDDEPIIAVTDRLADQLQQWNAGVDSVLLERMDAAMDDLFGRLRGKPAA